MNSNQKVTQGLRCKLCGEVVERGKLSEHLEEHNPNARTAMNPVEVRNQFEQL